MGIIKHKVFKQKESVRFYVHSLYILKDHYPTFQNLLTFQIFPLRF